MGELVADQQVLEKVSGVENGVCAVIITFRPIAEYLENLSKLRPQVQQVVVVDNGSSKEALSLYYAAQPHLNFHIIANGENLGIAAALNIGARWAKSQGYEFVILFDQDSTVSDGFIEAMLSTYREDPHRDRIGTIAPHYIDAVTGEEFPRQLTKQGDLAVVLTSGSLIPVNIFERCGWFLEEFVMDQYDFEFCLRLRGMGYRLVESENARMLHELGNSRQHNIGGGRSITSTHHNAKRRYYIARNRVRLLMLHWRKFPGYCFNLFTITIKDCVKIALVESDKFAKLKSTFLGIIDGILGRMGKRVEL